MAARLSDVHKTLPLARTARFSIHVSFGNVHEVAAALLLAKSRDSAATAVVDDTRSKTMAGIIVVS